MIEALQDNQTVLIHIEAQSKPDNNMAQRLLEYNVLAYRRYKCPIMSYVIYLRKAGKKRPPPTLVRVAPDGQEILRFTYREIELAKIAYEELFETGLKGLLPLVPLSLGGARKEIVEEVITRLLPAHDTMNKSLLVLTRLFASLAFRQDDDANQEWLKRRFAMLEDILQDTPSTDSCTGH